MKHNPCIKYRDRCIHIFMWISIYLLIISKAYPNFKCVKCIGNQKRVPKFLKQRSLEGRVTFSFIVVVREFCLFVLCWRKIFLQYNLLFPLFLLISDYSHLPSKPNTWPLFLPICRKQTFFSDKGRWKTLMTLHRKRRAQVIMKHIRICDLSIAAL